jgi:SAM-dependent methyltransferase
MKLSETRRHWENFARTDAFWAVLTSADDHGRRLSQEEFFATGEKFVAFELTRVCEFYPSLGRGRALDFGCGVGRLSQALAQHFDHVVGVDISTEMLARAASFNRHGDRVEYRHNPRPDLSLLPDASFDFVFSFITLQHIGPEYVRRYIAEFVRVCRPGGAILFQMPIKPPRRDPPQRLQFSFWPPTLWMRTKRYVRYQWQQRFPGQPLMEMNFLPQAEVLDLLRSSGAQVLQAWPDGASGEIESYSYLAVKSDRPE